MADEVSGDMHLVYTKGLSDEFINRTSFYPFDSPNAGIVYAGSPIYIARQDISRFSDALAGLENEGLRSVAVLPIAHKDKIIGCMNLASHTFDRIQKYVHHHLESMIAHLGDVIARVQMETKQKEIEEQLRQRQKMEALGALAGGIAHDFNNILQVIGGSVHLIEKTEGIDDRVGRFALDINNAVDNASDLIDRLLTFSRGMEPALKTIDINEMVEQAVAMLQRIIPPMIYVELRLSEGLAPIMADPNQVQQVIMNLGTNARDAMENGGKITISTFLVNPGREFHQRHSVVDAKDYIQITFADNGTGMKPDIAEHIFEPFFTTKKEHEGTGLGLSTVYGIVKAHGGHIHCDSQLGRGTVFNLYLPAGREEASETVKDHENRYEIVGGNETILIVDDDETIRNIASEILEDQGYTVIHASRAEEAVECYREYREAIDLVILDLGMPGKGGGWCLRVLLDIDLRAKIVISSGYSAESGVKQLIDSGARGFIGKPYRLDRMLGKIREILDE